MGANGNKKEIISKEDLLTDFKKVYLQLKKENPNLSVSRNYYDGVGAYTERQYTRHFKTFLGFKNAYLESEGMEFDDDKRRIILEEENKELKKDKNKLLKQSIDEESILKIYQEKQITIPPTIKFNLEKTDKKHKHDREAILMISDLHAGEVIVKEQLNSINEYDINIMKKRVDRIIHYAIYYCKKNEMDILNLLFLGDLMSGSIHPELIRTNESNDVETLFMLHEYLTSKLLEIEPHFSKIKVEFLVGNHSRISDGNSGTKPQWKTAPILNWEYVLARQLEMQFELIQKQYKTKKIQISVNNCLFKVIEVAKRKFLITHGHTMSSGSNSFAGIGYYGLAMSSAKMLGAMISIKDEDLIFSDILMGHLHNSARVKTTVGNMYLNGSIIGSGEFGLYRMKAVSEPEQTLLFVMDGYVNNEIILRGND